MHDDDAFTIELTESTGRGTGDGHVDPSGGRRAAVVHRIFGPARSQRTRISRGHPRDSQLRLISTIAA